MKFMRIVTDFDLCGKNNLQKFEIGGLSGWVAPWG